MISGGQVERRDLIVHVYREGRLLIGVSLSVDGNNIVSLTPQDAVPDPKAPGVPVSSSFIGPLWQVVAPAGGSAAISDGHLFVGVPGGSDHDALLPTNQAVRVEQPVGNNNFDVSIKIDSVLVATEANTSQGIIGLAQSALAPPAGGVFREPVFWRGVQPRLGP
jgi:hypothetical protein